MADFVAYRQTIKWAEDSWGTIVCRLVISDKYEGLFADNADSQEIGIVNIEENSISIKNQSGGIESRELSFSIRHSTTFTEIDLSVFEFIKQVENSNIRRFIGIFINTGNTPLPENLLFTGLINSSIEAEDLRWSGDHFDTTINAIRLYKFKATPTDDSVFGQFTMEDLIKGNPSKSVNGIDSAWETSKVKNRQGYFLYNNKRMSVYQLVNLNDVLRQLSDNLEQGLSSNGYADISIKFAKSQIDGNFHPARWKQLVESGTRLRYVQSPFLTKSPAFSVYNSDYLNLFIDPDGKPETYSEDEFGVPNNTESITYARESIWISYGFLKELDYEGRKNAAKTFRLDKYKSYFEFLNSVAKHLGLYLNVTWLNTTELEIKFVGRTTITSKQITLRSAIKANLKPSNNNIEERKYVGKSTYLALEGADTYVKDGAILFESVDINNEDGDNIILTLSPTLCGLTFGNDSGYKLSSANLPHNHFHFNDGISWLNNEWSESAGFHSAIYLFAPKYTAHPDSAFEPANYFTPAAALTIEIDSLVTTYYKMSDYLNVVDSLDNGYKMFEYNIEFPWFYGAKHNDNLSWNNIDIYNSFNLDGTLWVIVECKWNFTNKTVNIVAHSQSKFSFLNTIPDAITPPIFTILPDNYQGDTSLGNIADSVININDIVSRKSNGNYEKAQSKSAHSDRVVGLALNDAEIGDYVTIQESGIVESSIFSSIPINTLLFLRTNAGSNISISPLTAKTVDEDYYCIVGQVIRDGAIKLSSDFRGYIFE